jgi:hypothetical protein
MESVAATLVKRPIVKPAMSAADSGRTVSQYVVGTHRGIKWGIARIGVIFPYLSFTRLPRPR